MAQQAADLDDESLASEAELELVAALRAELQPELGALAAAGCDFAHVVGDVFLTRVVRGCDRDVVQAAAWYRKYLALRKEHGLDDIYRQCVAAGAKFEAGSMPGAAEVRRYYNTHFDEASLRTPQGYLIWYDSLGDVDQQAMKADMDRFKTYIKCVSEMRAVTADRLSREEKRLIKMVRVLDCEGVSPWGTDPEVFKMFRDFFFAFMKATSIEMVHRLYVVNCAWFAIKMYGFFSGMMPARMKSRSTPLGADFMSHDELTRYIPGDKLARLSATRSTDGDDGTTLQGSNRMLFAGGSMNKSVPAKAGQTVSWSFSMGLPSAAEASPRAGAGVADSGLAAMRGFAGAALDRVSGEVSDVFFGVSLWSESDGGSANGEDVAKEKVLVAPAKVDAGSGVVEGSVQAPFAGTVVLRWDNSESWVRAKLVAQYDIRCA